MMRLSIALIAVLAFASCKSNTSTGSNTNPSGGQSGADYFPLTNNTLWTGHITGSTEDMDQYGNATQLQQVDADYKAALGFIETRNGKNVYPVFAFDTNGYKVNYGAAIGYIGILDSEVFAFNQYNNQAGDAATILPATISTGQSWTPAPEALPIQCQASLVQHLAQYTNKGGTSYNDVIQIHVTYLDSTFNNQYSDSTMNKYSANTDLYFANGVGLVEADVHSYEYLNYDIYYGAYYSYQHKTASGTVWRKN